MDKYTRLVNTVLLLLFRHGESGKSTGLVFAIADMGLNRFHNIKEGSGLVRNQANSNKRVPMMRKRVHCLLLRAYNASRDMRSPPGSSAQSVPYLTNVFRKKWSICGNILDTREHSRYSVPR